MAVGEIPGPYQQPTFRGSIVPTDVEIIEALRPVEDPELRRSIVDLGMVKGAEIDGGAVRVTVALTTPGCPLKNEINSRVRSAVIELPGWMRSRWRSRP
jgi:ATP-binding protein involved in chromosome partitioning